MHGGVRGGGDVTPFLYVNLHHLTKGDEEDDKTPHEGKASDRTEDIVSTFVYLTEVCLTEQNPVSPKVSQLIDLEEGGLGWNTGLLKKVYEVFEANYPECLDKVSAWCGWGFLVLGFSCYSNS